MRNQTSSLRKRSFVFLLVGVVVVLALETVSSPMPQTNAACETNCPVPPKGPTEHSGKDNPGGPQGVTETETATLLHTITQIRTQTVGFTQNVTELVPTTLPPSSGPQQPSQPGPAQSPGFSTTDDILLLIIVVLFAILIAVSMRKKSTLKQIN